LDAVIEAAIEHARTTGLAPMWAVTLLGGVNDGAEHAHALAARITEFTARAGVRPRLSIVPDNSIGTAAEGEPGPFVPANAEREGIFREALASRGVHAHRRYSGGADVAAACGQLAGR